MPRNRFTQRRRTPAQVRADERTDRLATFLGRALAEGRERFQVSQAEASAVAGLSQSCWSNLERGHGAQISLRVWMRAADAIGSDVRAYLEQLAGADQPRDAMHLRIQELVASIARSGGWRLQPEGAVAGIGFADLLLARAERQALIEVWTWLADVGDAFRSWTRKLDRLAAATLPGSSTPEGTGPSAAPISGCWILRATRRNRALVAEHPTVFEARFSGSARRWLSALQDPSAHPPDEPALLWVSVRGDRLFAPNPRRADETDR